MKFLILGLAIVAVACAEFAPSNEYLPPTELAGVSNEYLAPQESAVLAEDGYRYKTVRRHRHRRETDQLTSYLPPAQEAVEYAPQAAFEAAQDSAVFADDGYRYKTVRRQRRRRQTDQLTSYLPPVQESAEYAAAPTNEYLAPQESAVLAEDGYRYKTVRRQRRRRETDQLTSYLPPVQESAEYAAAPSNEYLAPQESAVLAEDGYRYKTVRRQRRRREVNQLTSYLPPAQEAVEYAPEASFEAAQDSAVFADDGYRYKTVRRQRRRRETDQLTSYLPPVQESAEYAAAPSNEYLAPQESAVLAQDGYRYKTVRRQRRRRETDQLTSYLPPAQEAVQYQEAAPAFEQGAIFGDEGYRYKTVKRFRQRRH